MTATLLTVRGLARRVGSRQLFDIPELVFPRATAVALTGVNGAGKSTLLRMMAGLEPAPGATVAWEDAGGTRRWAGPASSTCRTPRRRSCPAAKSSA